MPQIIWDIPKADVEGIVAWRPKTKPDVQVSTWYRINGDLQHGLTPILVVHGGPGCPHDYLLNWTNLIPTGHPIIFYDQVGCGKSTSLREKEYRSLFNNELFVEEMGHVVDHLKLERVILVGHSYGAYLVQDFALRNPKLISALCIVDGMQDTRETVEAVRARLKELPTWVEEAVLAAEKKGEFDGEGYKKANEAFVGKFLADVETAPEQVMASLGQLENNTHVYGTMYGPRYHSDPYYCD